MKRYWIVALALVLAACGGGGQGQLLRSDRPARSRVVVGVALRAPGFRGAAERIQGGESGRGDHRRHHRRRRRKQRPGRARRTPAGRRSARRVADIPWQFVSRLGQRRPDRRRVRRLRKLGLGSDHAGDIARCGDLPGQGMGRADRVPPREHALVQPARAERGRRRCSGSRLHDGGLRSDLAKVAASGRRRCAWAGRTGSPRQSYSRTPCSAWSAPMAGRRSVTTRSTGAALSSKRR